MASISFLENTCLSLNKIPSGFCYFLVCLVSLDDSHELLQGSTYLQQISLRITFAKTHNFLQFSLEWSFCSGKRLQHLKSKKYIFILAKDIIWQNIRKTSSKIEHKAAIIWECHRWISETDQYCKLAMTKDSSDFAFGFAKGKKYFEGLFHIFIHCIANVEGFSK